MTSQKKPEIKLELCSGTFRIPTEDAVYIVTVLAEGSTKATKVVEKIVETEKGETGAFDRGEAEMPGTAEDTGGDYYKQVSRDVYHDIGQLAKSLSETMTDIPMEDRKQKRVELGEAGEKIEDAKSRLKDIIDMTEKASMDILDQVEKVQGQTNGVKDLLALLKDHQAFGHPEENPEENETLLPKIQQLAEILNKAQQSAEQQAVAPPPAEPAVTPQPASERKIIFDLDTVFQTFYELCTNETVKTHITAAREQADDILDKDGFLAAINQKIKDLQPDGDNFMQVPMADLLEALHNSCSDKKVQNLFKNMNANQESIFLETTLPLEASEVVEAAEPADSVPDQEQKPEVNELPALLREGIDIINGLREEYESGQLYTVMPKSLMSLDDQKEIFGKIEEAFSLASLINVDTSKITEVLSFQDLSGQQIMKIIKLLSDFQVQLLGIVVSFGSQLKYKEENTEITPEEGKRLAQEDVDRYMNKVTPSEKEEAGMLDQEAVNSILEEMGF